MGEKYGKQTRPGGDYSNYSEATKLTLGDVMRRYISEGYHVNKKDKSIEGRVRNICNDSIAGTNLCTLHCI